MSGGTATVYLARISDTNAKWPSKCSVPISRQPSAPSGFSARSNSPLCGGARPYHPLISRTAQHAGDCPTQSPPRSGGSQVHIEGQFRIELTADKKAQIPARAYAGPVSAEVKGGTSATVVMGKER